MSAVNIKREAFQKIGEKGKTSGRGGGLIEKGSVDPSKYHFRLETPILSLFEKRSHLSKRREEKKTLPAVDHGED